VAITFDDLKSFVSKLNDRELQMQRATGITMWAILGGSGLIIVDLAERIEKTVNQSVSFADFVLLQTLVYNCITTVMLAFIGLVLYSEGGIERRLESVIRKETGLVVAVPLTLVFAFMAAFNILSAVISFGDWFHFFAVIVVALFFSGNLIAAVVVKIRKWRTVIDLPEPVQLADDKRKRSAVECWIFSAIVALLLVFAIINTSFNALRYSAGLLVEQIVLGVEVYSLLVLVVVFSVILQRRYRLRWLIDLERSIHLSETTKETIANRLEEELFGPPVVRWMKKQENALEEDYENFTKLYMQFIDDLDKIKDGDTLRSVKEHTVKNVCSKLVKEIGSSLKVRGNIMASIDSIAAKGSLSNNEEEAKNGLRSRVARNREELAAKAREVCRRCRAAFPDYSCSKPVNDLLSD